MDKKPNEELVEKLLTNLKSEPSERFYKKMETAPWKIKPEKKIIRFPLKKVAAIAIVSLALLVLFQPSQVLAQLVNWFFQVQPSEGQITFTIPEPTATYLPTTPRPLPDISHLELPLPAYLPDAYIVEDIHINRRQGIADVYYTLAGENPLGRSLALFESRGEAYELPIGNNAVIQTIELDGGIEAQYVQGNWETIDSNALEGEITIRYRWDGSVQMHHLLWENDGIYFRLFWQAAGIPLDAYYGDGAPDEVGYLSLEDLIRIAESIH